MAQHFDVAVVGMQMSGVIAAALLAKRGRRVLLVDHGENTVTYRRKGLALPLLPSLLPALEHAPQIQKVHDELGLGPELRAQSKAMEPAFQAIMPRHRMDIRSQREALLHELRLEFPELVQPVKDFFERLFALDEQLSTFLAVAPPLPPNNWRERWSCRSALARMAPFDAPFESDALLAGIPPQHPVRDLLLGPLTFFGHLWNDSPSTFHAVRLIARYFRGVNALDNGTGGLARLLLLGAERAGVTVRRNTLVRSVQVAGRKLVDLTLEDDRLTHTAEYFIANTVQPFSDLLPADKRHPRFLGEEQSSNPTGSMLVLNLVVDKKVIPCGMGAAMFLLNGRREKRGEEPMDPPLFVQRLAASTGDGHAPAHVNEGGQEVLSVACPVRVQDIAHTPARLTAMKNQILGRLRRVVPFLDDYLRDVSMPIDTSGWDADSDKVRRIDPWRLHPIYEPGKRPILGIATRPMRTYYKNLLHCGPDVLPGLGLEGEYIAGVNAASILQKMAGRRWQT